VVTTLVERESAAGAYSVSWDGRDQFGVKVASGVYFANLETSKEAVTGKFMVVR
jgi:flagellar hook assembly protein FlgD